jgi:hypothetical protein
MNEQPHLHYKFTPFLDEKTLETVESSDGGRLDARLKNLTTPPFFGGELHKRNVEFKFHQSQNQLLI